MTQIVLHDELLEWLGKNVTVRDGQLYSVKTRRRTTRQKINAELSEDDMPFLLTQAQEEVYIAAVEADQQDAMTQKLSNCEKYDTHEEYIVAKARLKQIIINEKGDWTRCTDGQVFASTVSEFVEECHLELVDYNNNIPSDSEGHSLWPPLREKKELVTAATNKWVRVAKQSRITDARSILAYDQDVAKEFNLDVWARELLLAYGLEHNVPESVTVLKHMLWSIKRNVFMKDIDLPLFYILYSKRQEIGKTTLLQKHFARDFQFAYNGNMVIADMLDQNGYTAKVRDTWLIDFQELVVGGKGVKMDSDVYAKLKGVVTDPYCRSRGMYTHESKTERVWATMASSANVHIYDLIKDQTGMRRYWEFNFNPQGPEKPFEKSATQEILGDFGKAYKAIDENYDAGYLIQGTEMKRRIEAVQAEYVKKVDIFSKFLTSSGMELGYGDEDMQDEMTGQGFAVMKLATLTHNFTRWLQRNGENSTNWSTSRVRMALGNISIHPFDLPNAQGKGFDEYVWVKK